MTEVKKDSDNASPEPTEEVSEEEAVAEKKRQARRRFLIGAAATGAVTLSITPAHPQMINASQCVSDFGLGNYRPFDEYTGSFDLTGNNSFIANWIRYVCVNN